MYCVYWIRLPEYFDPSSEGYIGISKDLINRLRAHKKNKRKTPLVSAIQKYGWDNLIVEVLHENLDMQEALSIEKSLRPDQRIGWNCQIGGELGVESSWYDIPDNRQKHSYATSAATKHGIALKDTTEARAERARENHRVYAASYRDAVKGSKNPRALLNEEQVKEIKSLLRTIPLQELADMFGVHKHVIYQIKSGKNWSHV